MAETKAAMEKACLQRSSPSKPTFRWNLFRMQLGIWLRLKEPVDELEARFQRLDKPLKAPWINELDLGIEVQFLNLVHW